MSIDEARAFASARITEAFDELRDRIAHLERELVASRARTARERARRRAVEAALRKRLGGTDGEALDDDDWMRLADAAGE